LDWLLTREACITFALAGAVLSSAASVLRIRQAVSAKSAKLMNYAGYAAMGASMLVFIIAGFRSPA